MTETLIALGQQLAGTVLPGLVTVIAALVAGLLVQQLRKLNVQVTAEQEKRLRLVVEDAIRAVEEAARRNPTMTSSAKEALAKHMLTERLKVNVPGEQLRIAIDAALPKVRMQLAGEPPPHP
jgi:hypothetical protein